MKIWFFELAAMFLGFSTLASPDTNLFSHPLSRADAVELALKQNTTILKGRQDLRAAYGIDIQLRAIVLPQFSAGGGYNAEAPSLVEQFPLPPPLSSYIQFPNQNWNAEVKVQESIYSGGRMLSALRSAKLTRQQALLNYQATLADTLLSVRVAYEDVLLAARQIEVHDASVQLLTRELEETQKRFHAGTTPQFDVLRAQVAVANERPLLIQAKNNYRISKNNLLNLLGVDLPTTIWEDVPVQLSGTLEALPYDIDLTAALQQALQRRPELAAMRKARSLRYEDLVTARAGYKPTAQVFGGYEWQSLPYENNLDAALSGWIAGAQLSWSVFDGGLTRGRIIQAQARYEQAQLDVDESARQIELDVRTAYSSFIEAREVLDSQQLVQQQAAEALRLAEARLGAGSGTQLDVLDAQTALTQARATDAQARHDYTVARDRLQRAVGQDMEVKNR